MMDTHDVGRGRGGTIAALKSLKCPTLIVGIESDILYPLTEQQFLAQHIPKSFFHCIQSKHGHDGFLLADEHFPTTIKHFIEHQTSSVQTLN